MEGVRPVHLLLAETVWLVHVGYVLFVVVGQLLVMAGGAAGWQWVRNVWFRGAHGAAIGIVAFETLVNAPCSLTVLQDYLLVQAGLPARGFTISPFRTPPGFWDTVYLLFAAAVALTFLIVPPRRTVHPVRVPAPRLAGESGE